MVWMNERLDGLIGVWIYLSGGFFFFPGPSAPNRPMSWLLKHFATEPLVQEDRGGGHPWMPILIILTKLLLNNMPLNYRYHVPRGTLRNTTTWSYCVVFHGTDILMNAHFMFRARSIQTCFISKLVVDKNLVRTPWNSFHENTIIIMFRMEHYERPPRGHTVSCSMEQKSH